MPDTCSTLVLYEKYDISESKELRSIAMKFIKVMGLIDAKRRNMI